MELFEVIERLVLYYYIFRKNYQAYVFSVVTVLKSVYFVKQFMHKKRNII